MIFWHLLTSCHLLQGQIQDQREHLESASFSAPGKHLDSTWELNYNISHLSRALKVQSQPWPTSNKFGKYIQEISLTTTIQQSCSIFKKNLAATSCRALAVLATSESWQPLRCNLSVFYVSSVNLITMFSKVKSSCSANTSASPSHQNSAAA